MNIPGEKIHETLRSRRADVERVAESVGVAALAVDSAALTSAQLHMIASGAAGGAAGDTKRALCVAPDATQALCVPLPQAGQSVIFRGAERPPGRLPRNSMDGTWRPSLP